LKKFYLKKRINILKLIIITMENRIKTISGLTFTTMELEITNSTVRICLRYDGAEFHSVQTLENKKKRHPYSGFIPLSENIS
jgi:hypothetical protein